MRHKRFLGIPILAASVAAALLAGAATAALVVSLHGSVEVVPPGGGGGGTPPPATYAFKLYDAASGGNEIVNGDNTFLQLGKVTTTYSTTKTVYIENSGTGAFSVSAAVDWKGATPTGTFSGLDAVAVPVGTTRVPMAITFTAGATAGSLTEFDVSFTETH